MDDGILQRRRALQETPVAGMDLKAKPTEDLVELAAAKKRRADFAKDELAVVMAEIQERADTFQKAQNVKFTEFFGRDRSFASVTVAQKVQLNRFAKLREALGADLADTWIRPYTETKYDIDDDFKRALIALALDDYEPAMTAGDVIDQAGWCAGEPKKKQVLLKKLRGDYRKDRKAVLAALNLMDGDIDLDAELYLIYQIRNWELIRRYFKPEELAAVTEAVKAYVEVDETLKVTLKAV